MLDWGIIQAGGKSARMREDKSWLEIGGRPMIEHGLSALRPVASRLAIVIRERTPQAARYAALADRWGAALLFDPYPDLGPLGGIAAALAAIEDARAPERRAVLLACDLPFVTSAFLARLAALSDTEDLLVPEDADGRAQPLAGLYSTRCRTAAEALLGAGRRRVDGLYDQVATRRIPFDQYRDLPGARRLLLNLNTPAEYRAALET